MGRNLDLRSRTVQRKLLELKEDMADEPFKLLEEAMDWVQEHGFSFGTPNMNAIPVQYRGVDGSPVTFLHLGETDKDSSYARRLGAIHPHTRGMKADAVFGALVGPNHRGILSKAEHGVLDQTWRRLQEECSYVVRTRDPVKELVTLENYHNLNGWAGQFRHARAGRQDFHDRRDETDLWAMLQVMEEYATRITGHTP